MSLKSGKKVKGKEIKMTNKNITYEENWILSKEEMYEYLKDTHTKEEIDKIIELCGGKPTREILLKCQDIDKDILITRNNYSIKTELLLTPMELRFMTYLISTLDFQKEKDLKNKVVSINDIAKACNLNPETTYKEINRICDSIMGKSIIIDLCNQKGKSICTIRRPWFLKLDTYEGPHKLLFQFHPELHDELKRYQKYIQDDNSKKRLTDK